MTNGRRVRAVLGSLKAEQCPFFTEMAAAISGASTLALAVRGAQIAMDVAVADWEREYAGRPVSGDAMSKMQGLQAALADRRPELHRRRIQPRGLA